MIAVEKLSVRAGDFQLENISFQIPAGECGFLMGKTGSGKTTLLEAICGLKRVVKGTIRLNDRDVTHWPPAQRSIGFVPQDGALFQTFTVREHLAFGLELRRWNRADIVQRTDEIAQWLGLSRILDRKPEGLSGGEVQRVALGRALSFRPAVLCLDEPLSALDDETRAEICDVIETVRERTGVTILHVSHNHGEAERLADRIFQLQNGRMVEQAQKKT